MTRILGISGSLRAGSFNTALLRAAQSVAGSDVQLDIATLHGIPLYDGDQEQREGIPPAVVALKEQVMASDGVIIATPEYNNSVPGVLKNAMDWLSRPTEDIARVYAGRPFALIGATPSGWGTLLAQNAWLGVLRHLKALHWAEGRIAMSKAHGAFDAEGKLTDETVREQLTAFVKDFAAFCATRQR